MTSAVRGGICNVSHRVVGLGCIGVVNGVYELVVLLNKC